MDNDVLRRGKPTVHVAFGEAGALLAGDALQPLAFELLTPADSDIPASVQADLCRLLAQASGHAGMAGGQAIDLASVGVALSLPELTRMHRCKTGALLEGSVRKAGDKLRITAQLVETESGAHIWSGKVEGGIADLFDLQDRIAELVAGAVYPSVRKAEIERARLKRPDSLAAYDLVMRALPHLWAHRMHENPEAIRLLDQALVIDPSYGLAAALAAWAHAQQIVYNWTADVAGEVEKGLALIERAARHIGEDATALTAQIGRAHV